MSVSSQIAIIDNHYNLFFIKSFLAVMDKLQNNVTIFSFVNEMHFRSFVWSWRFYSEGLKQEVLLLLLVVEDKLPENCNITLLETETLHIAQWVSIYSNL